MLSPIALRILGDSERVTNTTLRFFIRLLATYEMSRFKVLHMHRLIENVGMQYETISACIATLVAVGLLEEGPQGKIRGKGTPLNTYRIRPAMLVSPEEMLDWFRECREREEREALIPGAPRGSVSAAM